MFANLLIKPRKTKNMVSHITTAGGKIVN